MPAPELMQAVISHPPSVRVMMAGATSSGYLPAPSPGSRASILLGHQATFGRVTHCTDDRTAAASSPSSLRAETLRGRVVTPKTSDDGRRDAGHKRVADDSDFRGCTRHPRELRSPRASRAPKPILFAVLAARELSRRRRTRRPRSSPRPSFSIAGPSGRDGPYRDRIGDFAAST